MKIICIGRNYAEHALELKNELPTEPVVFLKPETALLPKNHPFIYPDHTRDLHYEVELVIKINKLGKYIERKFAHKYYSEIGIGIDFTARDLQQKCKEKGLPWEKAKAFDHSAPLGRKFISVSDLPNKDSIKFELYKNGECVQTGNSANMIFSFDEIIAYVSKYFTLKIGDMIMTGTPQGVGPCVIGDKLEAYIEDEKLLTLDVK